MRDDDFQEAVKHYDLATLRAARQRLDVTEFPERANLLEVELERRQQGIGATPRPDPSPFSISRDEGYAGFVYRFPALVIDLLLIYIPSGFLLERLVGANLLWAVVILPFIYPIYVIGCTWRWQQTLGKMMLGLMVTDRNGEPPGFSRCIARHVPDVIFALLMCGFLVTSLLGGMSLPEHGTAAARLSSFRFQLPIWDAIDDLWDLWLWSEMLFLCLDSRRRSLHEFISGTLVIHSTQLKQLDFHASFEPSWYEWLQQAIRRYS